MKKLSRNGLAVIIVLMLTLFIKSDVSAMDDYPNSEKTYTYGDFEYVYEARKKYIHITDYTGNEEVVVVPSKINGMPVRLAGGFGSIDEKKYKVKKIIISEGIEGIYWLNYCSNLEEIQLPETLKSIDKDTFNNCKKLKYINLPSSLEEIGEDCFSGCISLESIQIPDKVKEIQDGAFAFCENLKSVILPNGLKKIGESAFASCYSLKEFYIPDSVTKIEGYAFFGCDNLKSVRLSKNLKEIKTYTFACTGLKSITIPSKVKKIKSYAFASTNISKVTIPSKVTYLGVGAFRNCPKLRTITFKGKIPPQIKKWGFDDIYSKAVFNVPNKSISKYKKVLQNKKIYDGKKLRIK